MVPLTAVFSASFLGGSELFNLEFLRQASEHGVEIDAIVPTEGSIAEALVPTVRSVEVVELPLSLRSLSRFDRTIPCRTLPHRLLALCEYTSRLRRALQRTRGPICAFGFRSQLAVSAAGQGLGRRTCWVVHEIVPGGPFARLWTLAARRADAILAYSNAAASQPALAKVPVSVLPVRLELESFFGVPLPTPPPRVLGLVGDLFPIKNHLGFIDVVRRLRESGEAVEGRIYGRDTSRTNLTAEYVKTVHSAAEDCVMLSSAEPDEMPAKLAEMDLLLHLTKVPETFGRVCVEAMAAGRPVIGFDHGALSEVVSSGRTGILCRVDDLDAVALAVLRLRDDLALFRELSSEARRVARNRWGAGQAGHSLGEALAAFAAEEGSEAA
jgi:glycosyltransferase involved in cell wall biosynthesis